MEKKTHFYVSLKNGMTWLVVLCMVCSAVARVLCVGMKGTDDLWCQIVLPIAAAILYGLICLLNGKEQFYKTAIPVWMICIYYAFRFFRYSFQSLDNLIGFLLAVAMLFIAVMYPQITFGMVAITAMNITLAAFLFGVWVD